MTRIGLLVPSSNTVMEPDFQRHFAGRATVHAARMFLADPVTPEGELEMLDRAAEPAARDIGTLVPDVVVFGCTSAGALRGPAADRELRARLSRLSGAPVIGIVDSIAESLRRRKLGRISLFSPYTDELNEILVAGLESDGFEVVSAAGLGNASNLENGRVEPERIAARACRARSAAAEALVIPCTNFRALEAKDAIERETRLPVVTACSAAIEALEKELPWAH